MAWDEWEQLKSQAATRDSTHMRLNHAPDGGGTYGPYVVPGKTGDLKVGHDDLVKIGAAAHHLYDQLWDKARVAVPGSDSAAGDLSTQGFSVGAGLQHVSNRWEEQLKSLMDACAQISNHMQTTKTVHANDECYIRRQMSSIDALDAGFDERVGAPGKHNSIYGEPKSKKEKE
ncbi:hypothetical protein GTY20_30185 [Streptomyces sp. SID4946]|uniref:hypothetical protein n=1 Tax=Streptomyces TaxID=1883 RepID=UPI00081E42DB|nr:MULTISPECIES: hypothetical protein [unclassified Streptomyces]MYQ95240.1 hypothetical protein [Streptomyces sp. SID4946]SCF63808.1 hypothetical protein GA0115258_106027 [Streptomyces sp. LamerLS-31b]SCF94450.1 hypothetical protein GA0115256_135327 [Streptomyces sp. DconLS]